MLDKRFVLENAELVQQNCVDRGVKADVSRFVELETQRRTLLQEAEDLNRQANEVSKSIGKAKDDAEREARKEEGRQLREAKDAKQSEVDRVGLEADRILRGLPNMTHPESPRGDEAASHELRKGESKPPKFNFKPLDHLALAEQHDLIDFEGGSRVSGNGFYYLRNEAVLLEFALQRYALDRLMREGFTPTMTPDLARNEIVQGIGFIPRGPETQIYSIENSDLNLVATAEITLGGLHAGQVLDESQLPIKLAGVSHCFRTEAGAAGRAGRGLYRVHQFTKVEMFAFTTPDQSEDMHNLFLELECEIFDGLGVPFRVLDIASGDLGGPAYRKFDLEAWMPGRGQGGEYGEVTSTSNCTDYQSRRLDIRYKKPGEKGTHFVHTLNGTAVACGRAMIAILENCQQADGSILVPEVLRVYVGKDRIGAPDDAE
ncbi:serine--tRNA ligase [Botrimarina mediterranea]|uniref:Serine--tRNA ligase n=1 Tax=Botrimarina mediterranea TaxID=2528022 RepID=A0A518K5E7_9BACT|nr:serine--tRNA ligase [Botrimarina mediterranea]QDV73022.1 Serine--tRNA ligase [Botrimarina mediterranea]QDV77596.1 Serine--tRNA ligase [Planctomycetes bacterium K2D]